MCCVACLSITLTEKGISLVSHIGRPVRKLESVDCLKRDETNGIKVT